MFSKCHLFSKYNFIFKIMKIFIYFENKENLFVSKCHLYSKCNFIFKIMKILFVFQMPFVFRIQFHFHNNENLHLFWKQWNSICFPNAISFLKWWKSSFILETMKTYLFSKCHLFSKCNFIFKIMKIFFYFENNENLFVLQMPFVSQMQFHFQNNENLFSFWKQ